MFKKQTPIVLYAPQTREVHETRIEQRAPVADDVRLYKEVKEAAEKDIIKSVKLTGNGFSGEVQVVRNVADMSMSARCIFTLNGTEHVVTADTKSFRDTPDELIKRLYEAVAAEVSGQILGCFLDDALPQFRGLSR